MSLGNGRPPASHALAAHLATHDVCYTGWIGQYPTAGPTLYRAGYGAITFDLQHGRIDLPDTIHGIDTLNGIGCPTVVRIPVGEYQTASRVLDAGASGVIAPMVNNARDVVEALQYCKYPPIGERSWGPYGAMPQSGLSSDEFLTSTNRMSVLLVMVETSMALSNLSEILNVPALDGVFVGPSDLSIALSKGRSIDPESETMTQALEHIATQAKISGKVAGIFARTGQEARRAQQMGFRFIAVGDDSTLIDDGARHHLSEALTSEGESKRLTNSPSPDNAYTRGRIDTVPTVGQVDGWAT